MSALPATIERPNTPAETKKAKLPAVRGKLVLALKAIVWEGAEFKEAGEAAGLTAYQVRKAIDRPHVREYLRREREVFRAHVSAQNIHRAKQLRDESGNAMAQLGAMKFIEAMGDEDGARPGGSHTPGIVIMVGTQAPQQQPIKQVVDANE